ncbi:GNAT family N-acetyltransferase [Serratia nevei]|uniref:GNAT family N-acetyltransferase n=1 Tax=Serratia TaxID=613 RepID=UPI002177A7DE|nr:GNAT family N-acetyltransferase [Serratia marcescens]CAI1879483.1 Protease synthase and sporulation negative regulatory protein PAI 1 [Serratia marcescens]
MDKSVIIRRAFDNDAETLGVVGPAAYAAAYHYLWSDVVALTHQLNTFSKSAFLALLQRPDSRVWVAEIEGEIVGFLTMLINSKNPITHDTGGAEISRVYLLPGCQKMGIGQQLLNTAQEYAKKIELTHMWLDVMASATAARSAYCKWGFSDMGRKKFSRRVKEDLSEMVVMGLKLNAKDL